MFVASVAIGLKFFCLFICDILEDLAGKIVLVCVLFFNASFNGGWGRLGTLKELYNRFFRFS